MGRVKMDGILVDLERFVSIFLTAKTKSEVTKLHAYFQTFEWCFGL